MQCPYLSGDTASTISVGDMDSSQVVNRMQNSTGEGGMVAVSERRFRRSSELTYSGVEWLGMIPLHWQSRRLKQLAKIVSGGTPEKDNLEYWSGDIPWVSPKDMKGRVVVDSLDHITNDAILASSTRLVGQGSVLMVVRSGILRHRIPVAVAAREVTLNQDLKAFLLLGDVSSKFLAYFIEGMSDVLLVMWRKEGATVESLVTELIEKTHIPIPLHWEQRAIANFLDRETSKIDSLIKRKERLIELLQEKRIALISHAVTKGLDPDIPLKDSGVEWLGKIPAHWEVIPLKSILIRNDCGAWGEDSASDGTIVLRSTEQTVDGKWSIDNPARRLLTEREVVQTRLDVGDLVVTKSSGSQLHIGKTSIVDRSVADLGCGFSNFMQRLRLNCRHEARFYWYLMNVPVAREQFVFLSSTTTGLGNLNASILGAIRVAAAPLSQQRAIATFLDRETEKLDLLISKIRQAIELLTEYRIALISAAVTGKIDVREAA